jgi:hypothetical protein
VQDFRPTKKISLKVNESRGLGGGKLFTRFNLFSQQPAPPGAMLLGNGHAFLHLGHAQINLKNVRHFGERRARIVECEVVQRDQISGLLQPLQRGENKVISRHRLEDLGHRQRRRQQGHVVLEQDIARAVRETTPPVAQEQGRSARRYREYAARPNRNRFRGNSLLRHRETRARNRRPFRRRYG